MNFITEFYKNLNPNDNYIPLTTGLEKFDFFINRIRKSQIFFIFAPPKTGKTSFVDTCFVLNPIKQITEEKNKNVKFIYFAFETSRLEKEANFISHYLYTDYNMIYVNKNGFLITKERRDKFWHDCEQQNKINEYYDNIHTINSSIIMGNYYTQKNHRIIIKDQKIINAIKEIYEQKIINLFGEYTEEGNKIKDGLIDYYEESDNPTGIYKLLKKYAEENGKFIKSKKTIKDNNNIDTDIEYITGYKENNNKLQTIIIIDHTRLLKKERGYDSKANLDKFLEYCRELKKFAKFTFILIGHSNRNFDIEKRKKTYGEIYPIPDDVKDTGNFGEDVDIMISLLNPNTLNLQKHFNLNGLRTENNKPRYPNLITMHILLNRGKEADKHLMLLIDIPRLTIKNFSNY